MNMGVFNRSAIALRLCFHFEPRQAQRRCDTTRSLPAKYIIGIWVCLLPLVTGCIAGSGGFIENDTLALDSWLNKNEDRNLTQTSGIAWDSSGEQNAIHRGLRRVNQIGLRELVKHKACEFELAPATSIAVTAYTPDDLESFQPVIGDRPFATLLSLSGSNFTRCENKNREVDEIWTSSFSLGFLGTTLGEDFQRWAHETGGVSRNTPNGWDNQISDGGEPTFLYSLNRSRLFNTDYKSSQFSYSVGANIGYYTNINAGLLYRALLSGSEFRSDFQDVGGTQIVTGNLSSLGQTPHRDGQDNTADESSDSDTGLSFSTFNSIPVERIFFAGITTYGVLYNSVLQGQFRDTEYDLNESQINHLLFQLTLGVSDSLRGWCQIFTWNYIFNQIPRLEGWCSKITRNPTRMTFALHAQSAEYNSEWEVTKPHVWAGLHFTNISAR